MKGFGVILNEVKDLFCGRLRPADEILRPLAYSVCELLPTAKLWTVQHQDDTLNSYFPLRIILISPPERIMFFCLSVRGRSTL